MSTDQDIQDRRCPSCQCVKAASDFYTSHGRPHGYCKPCARAKESQRHHDKVINLFGADEVKRREAIRKKKANARPGYKVCARCLEEKKTDQFYKTKYGLESYCVECRCEYDKARHAKCPRSRLVTLLGAARRRAINNGWAFSLEIEDLVTLWEDQEGKCWYTKTSMTIDGTRRPEALSVDRVDSNLGYTQDNVVLCCRRVNEIKREMTIGELRRWCSMILRNTERENDNE